MTVHIDHKLCSINRAARIAGVSRVEMVAMASKGQVRFVKMMPWVFNTDELAEDLARLKAEKTEEEI